MKRTYAAIILLLLATVVALTGCKKDKDSDGNVIASLADSTGNVIMLVTYNSDNKVSRITTTDVVYDFTYSDSKLIKRTHAQGGAIMYTDSFFYDGNERFARIDRYDVNMDMAASTVFAYNGNNTINTINFNSSVIGTPDKLFEFTYNGGNLSVVKENEKVLGNFNLRRQYEFLAFDDRQNPVQPLIKDYLSDQVNLITVLFWSSNNFTSAKQTDYNLNTGDVTGVVTIAGAYTYADNGMPSQLTATINGNTNRISFNYTTL